MICKDKSGQIRLDSDTPLTPQGFTGPMQQVVLELKIQHKDKAATLAQGLLQTARYAAQCGADSAHLLIFDSNPADGIITDPSGYAVFAAAAANSIPTLSEWWHDVDVGLADAVGDGAVAPPSVVVAPLKKFDPIGLDQIDAAMFLRDSA